MTIGSATAHRVEAEDVHKEYPTPGEPLRVLRGVSLELVGGQALAIIGPSGSGKSTLLNILGTLDVPTSGTVRLDGTDAFALSARDLAKFRARQIGFVFQDHHLLPQCTAVENVLVARLAVGRAGAEELARAEGLLEQVGLAERRTHLPSELSGGERQRVAIARALMNRPSLLLADEPTGNLDAKTSQAVARLLLDVAANSGAMLIAVTHSLQMAALFARKMRMEEGRLIDV